jgi:hypothetical protein
MGIHVGARLARDAGDEVFHKPSRLFREQALLPHGLAPQKISA